MTDHVTPDIRYRYAHKCEGCEGSFADCQPLWREQRKCCPDCTHGRVFPPPGNWRQRDAELREERLKQLEAEDEAGRA